jgi:hypothetical protein
MIVITKNNGIKVCLVIIMILQVITLVNGQFFSRPGYRVYPRLGKRSLITTNNAHVPTFINDLNDIQLQSHDDNNYIQNYKRYDQTNDETSKKRIQLLKLLLMSSLLERDHFELYIKE